MKYNIFCTMDSQIILFVVAFFAICFITIISFYINRSRNEKKKQIADANIPRIDDNQEPENTDSIIQNNDYEDVVFEPIDIEPTVKIISSIKTTGKDEYYNEKLLSQNWKDKAESIKKRDGYQCQHCFGLTILENIDEIKNYVDYPEVGELVIDIFKNKEQYYKTPSEEYQVGSNKLIAGFYFTELLDTDFYANAEKIDIITTFPLNKENVCGTSTFKDVDSSFRYNVKDLAKKTNSLGIIYFVDGNTNNQLILRNIEWYKSSLPYAKQGILTLNGLSIVFPLLSIKKEYLDVHHLAYYEGLEPWECPDNELITICHRCHLKAHEQEVPVKKIFSSN